MLESLAAAFRVLANTPVVPVASAHNTSIELDTYTVDPIRAQTTTTAAAHSAVDADDSDVWARIPRVSSLRLSEARLKASVLRVPAPKQ